MMKFSNIIPFLILFLLTTVWAQDKYEREYRIRKSQFPEKAFSLIKAPLQGARQVRYYKEVDSAKITYKAKFRKDRLYYHIEFDERGTLVEVGVLISKIDVPIASYEAIAEYLNSCFRKYRTRKIQQQYTISSFGTASKTLDMAFQNLIDPKINYKLIVSGKQDGRFQDFELLFDANGKFIRMRKSLPANYDHVLY